MEDVVAGDAAYGAGNEGAAEEAGPLQVSPACLLRSDSGLEPDMTSATERSRALDEGGRLTTPLLSCYEQGGDAAENGHAEESKQAADEPKKIGYQTFPNGQAAYKYYKMLLRDLTQNQDLNEVCHCKAQLLHQTNSAQDLRDAVSFCLMCVVA